jgi:hypothetical protein
MVQVGMSYPLHLHIAQMGDTRFKQWCNYCCRCYGWHCWFLFHLFLNDKCFIFLVCNYHHLKFRLVVVLLLFAKLPHRAFKLLIITCYKLALLANVLKINFVFLLFVNLKWQWWMSSWKQCLQGCNMKWRCALKVYVYSLSSKICFLSTSCSFTMHYNFLNNLDYSCCSLFIMIMPKTHECLLSFVGTSQHTHHFFHALIKHIVWNNNFFFVTFFFSGPIMAPNVQVWEVLTTWITNCVHARVDTSIMTYCTSSLVDIYIWTCCFGVLLW